MTPDKHQVKMAKQGLAILKEHMLVYLAGEERVGKSLPTVMIAEALKVPKVLIITKKKAIEGWLGLLKVYPHKHDYTMVNYEMAKAMTKSYDLIVLDEAHNFISSFPNPSTTWYHVAKLTKKKPIIYVSATPHAQGYQLLYHQFALSNWSPWWEWYNAQSWFQHFGTLEFIWTPRGQQPVYTNIDPNCFNHVEHLFVTLTRKEAGFEHEPVDKLHYITLSKSTKAVYNALTKEKAIVLNELDVTCDTISKLRSTLHMLEGGVLLLTSNVWTEWTDRQTLLSAIRYLKLNKESKVRTVLDEFIKQLYITGKTKIQRNYCQLNNREKISYILKTWGDNDNIAIMYNYIAEKTKLEKAFKKARILQATTYAEGIDLYEYKHLIIYSQDWSTARHVQRRARQANKWHRTTPIIVHYLLVEKAISDQVYQCVSVNKQNYIDTFYQNTLL